MSILRQKIRVEVLPVVGEGETTTITGGARVAVAPAKTPNLPDIVQLIRYDFDIIPLVLDIGTPIKQLAKEYLRDILDSFIDEERKLKTVLNLGEDTQHLILHKRYGNLDATGTRTLQLKLLTPLAGDVEIGKRAFVSRELAKSFIDKTRIRYAPRIDDTRYLRPRNERFSIEKTGNALKDVTLNVLSLQTGSVGAYDASYNRTFEDSIFREWYSYDFDSSELNLNFTNYKNFVFYGSAAMRLAAFREKVKKISDLNNKIAQFSGTVFTGEAAEQFATASISYILETSEKFALEKEDVIRSFDRYEQHLYFTKSGSVLPYSASFDYVDGGIEYNSISYWPKDTSGNLYDATSAEAIDWYESQLEIAQRYDDFNQNNLINTIPMYLREDDDSQSYITFVSMTGHFFDLIKPYIDQMPYIYDRYIDPNQGISKDLIETIAQSVGFTLPSLNSLYSLSDNILGEVSAEPRREFTVETQKRLLHSLPLFAKSKGTRKALSTLLRTFGITEQLINVREEGTPESSSVYVYDEFTSGLDFDNTQAQYIKLPLSDGAYTVYPRSIQMSLTVAKNSNMTVLSGDSLWSLNVVKHPTYSSLGKFELVSGSTTVLSSSYERIFGDELLNVSIRTYDTGSYANLFVTQTDGEDVIFSSSLTEPASSSFVGLWNSTNSIYVGGSGSADLFDGTIDEIRLWAINLSNEMVLNTAFDPGSNAGDAYTDASDYLYGQISFNRIDTGSLALSSSLLNESPYKDKAGINLETFEVYNVELNDINRYNRTIRQLVSDYGQSAYVTRKIKIASPPVFENNFIDDDGTYHLSRTKSIVTPRAKRRQQFNKNKVAISMSPTQIINTNIIRNIGLENINSLLGVPRDFYVSTNTSLYKLKKHYAQYYYADINVNQYIRILSSVASVLNQVVNYFVPSRASLLQGFVLEQNILERVYLTRIKNIRFYGGNNRGARRTINAASSLTGSAPDYEATFNLSQTIPQPDLWSASAHYKTYTSSLSAENYIVTGSYNTYTSSISFDNYTTTASYHYYTASLQGERPITASYHYYTASLQGERPITASYHYYTASMYHRENTTSEYVTYDLQHLTWEEYILVSQSLKPHEKQRIDVGLSNMNKIPFNNTNAGSEGAEPFNRLYTRKLYQYEIDRINNSLTKGINEKALYEIKPIADFDLFSVTNYFSQPQGVYYFDQTLLNPSYQRQIKATWDFGSQQFTSGVTTWSYGSRYDIGDVVYQAVSKYDSFANNIIGLLTSSKAGNDKYYVYKRRTQESIISGSVGYVSGSGITSFIPPSLDQASWDVLRFRPLQKRVPKRITFDTVLFSDPKDNDYKTTRVELDKIINEQTRYVDSFSPPNIASGSYVRGEIALQNISALFAVQSNNSPIRLRLYRTSADSLADLDRGTLEDPVFGNGVLADIIINQSNSPQIINPAPILVADSNPPAGRIFYTINNLTSSSLSTNYISLYYFALQVENRIPLGYLQKHYRFYRDNSTATKRRNWLGCKNTDQTTADGLPVVQVFVQEGVDAKVSPTLLDNEISLGGGGTLEA